jgi:hypothetical protein
MGSKGARAPSDARGGFLSERSSYTPSSASASRTALAGANANDTVPVVVEGVERRHLMTVLMSVCKKALLVNAAHHEYDGAHTGSVPKTNTAARPSADVMSWWYADVSAAHGRAKVLNTHVWHWCRVADERARDVARERDHEEGTEDCGRRQLSDRTRGRRSLSVRTISG